MTAGIAFFELLHWIGSETAAYRGWFAQQPAAVWRIPVGDGQTATVRDLLFHVYMVDLRYAQRLHGLAVSAYESEPAGDADALFDLAARGQALLRGALDGGVDLERRLVFQTRSAGELRASGRKILAHTLTHHIRHLAQVATALRQQGHPTGWMHDLLMSDALD